MNSEATTDQELSVLLKIVEAIGALPPEGQQRAMAYLNDRFEASPGKPRQAAAEVDNGRSGQLLDVKSFRDQKQPANGQEMAALIAYYVSNVLPEPERRPEITPIDVDRYFKQARYPLPTRTRSVLI